MGARGLDSQHDSIMTICEGYFQAYIHTYINKYIHTYSYTWAPVDWTPKTTL